MADEPPPLSDCEDEGGSKEDDGEDLFSTAATGGSDEGPPTTVEDPLSPTQEPPAVIPEPEPPAVIPEPEPPAPTLEPTPEPVPDVEPPTLEPQAADEGEVTVKPVIPPVKTLDLFEDDEPTQPQGLQGEEEDDNVYELTIKVSSPEKIGDGMGAYLVYTITTKTSIPSFHSPENSVRRRFSDFLGLSHKLNDKYLHKGRIVPPTPEKSVKGMTMVKFSKSEESGAGFVERRRAALERYLMRIGKHPALRKDEDFRDFLENSGELPKAKDTAAMSGAGFMRLVKNVGESISKIAGKKSETDSWFEEQQQNYEQLDTHLKKLLQAIETMIGCRKELCSNTNTFVKSVATLGNVEENDSVSRALSRLSEVQEKVETLHQEQLQHDLFTFGETVKDYVALLGAIRAAFVLRVKQYNTWQSSQNTLDKKKESEQKLQAGGKPEKLQHIQMEIKEWEEKVEEGQRNFEDASKTLREEVDRFERERAQEFKEKFISYLESLMHMQQELIRLWEGYLPDAQAIV